MTKARTSRRGRSGQAFIELAITVTLFAIIFAGAYNIISSLTYASTIQAAAQTAVRQVVLIPCANHITCMKDARDKVLPAVGLVLQGNTPWNIDNVSFNNEPKKQVHVTLEIQNARPASLVGKHVWAVTVEMENPPLFKLAGLDQPIFVRRAFGMKEEW